MIESDHVDCLHDIDLLKAAMRLQLADVCAPLHAELSYET